MAPSQIVAISMVDKLIGEVNTRKYDPIISVVLPASNSYHMSLMLMQIHCLMLLMPHIVNVILL